MSDTIDLNSQEVKDAIKAAVAEATEGLVSKRDELLAEVKKLKQGRDIKPEDMAKLEADLDTLRSQLDAASREAKKQAGEAEKASKALIAERERTTKLLVDNGLNEALAKAGVNSPAYIKAAKALLAGQVQVVADGDQMVARFGDKPLHEAITEWAGSDEGKHFVSAPDISGGGSQGGRGNSNPNPPKGDAGGDKAAMVARAQELLAQHED